MSRGRIAALAQSFAGAAASRLGVNDFEFLFLYTQECYRCNESCRKLARPDISGPLIPTVEIRGRSGPKTLLRCGVSAKVAVPPPRITSFGLFTCSPRDTSFGLYLRFTDYLHCHHPATKESDKAPGLLSSSLHAAYEQLATLLHSASTTSPRTKA